MLRSLGRPSVLFSCELPSNVGAPMFPLPAAALTDTCHGCLLDDTDRSRDAGCMVLALAARPDVGLAASPPRVRNAGSHRVDAGTDGGRVQPMLLRGDGCATPFPALHLQVRYQHHAGAGCEALCAKCPHYA
jgi:hypothetical protein